MKCGWFSPLQVFISDEVFYFHLRDLVVVQIQVCDGGREVWEIQITPNITNVMGRLSIFHFITCFKNMLNPSIILTNISSVFASFSCALGVQCNTVGG